MTSVRSEDEPAFARTIFLTVGGATLVGATVGVLFWWLGGRGEPSASTSTKPALRASAAADSPAVGDQPVGDTPAPSVTAPTTGLDAAPRISATEPSGTEGETTEPLPPPKPTYRGMYEDAKKALRHGQSKQALALIEKAIGIRETGQALTVKADVLLHLGDKTRALAAAETAVIVQPTYAPAWYFKGNIHLALGHKDKARIAFQKFLELDPDGKKAAEVQEQLDKME
jgi:hypothetical protein